MRFIIEFRSAVPSLAARVSARITLPLFPFLLIPPNMSHRPRAAPADPLPYLRPLIRSTTLLQTLSAGTFASFLVVHLAAPLSAIVGGEEAASGFMLIGREWYQGNWSEWIVVGSGVVHVLAGVGGRAMKGLEGKVKRAKRRGDVRKAVEGGECSSSGEGCAELTARLSAFAASAHGEDELPSFKERTTSQLQELDALAADELPAPSGSTSSLPVPSTSPPLTLHHLTGYLLIPLTLQHLTLHRLLPLKYNLTSFLSYSFVSRALNAGSWGRYRLPSAVGYALLTAVTTWHAFVGVRILWDPTAPRGLGRRRNEKEGGAPNGWQGGWVALLAGVGVGVARIATSGGARGPEWIGRKFDLVQRVGWGY